MRRVKNHIITCVECGKPANAKKQGQVTCGKKCAHDRIVRKRKERLKRKKWYRI